MKKVTLLGICTLLVLTMTLIGGTTVFADVVSNPGDGTSHGNGSDGYTSSAGEGSSGHPFTYYFPDENFAQHVAEQLDMNKNDLVTIDKLHEITRIDIRFFSSVKSIDGIGYLKGLEHLQFTNVSISEIPDDIVNLKQLKVLALDRLPLTEFPEIITDLTCLETLSIRECSISTIPESIGNLSNLTNLTIFGDSVSEIPESISLLSNLEYIELAQNNITLIPDSIGELSNLEHIFLSHNPISYIPDSVKNLENLSIIQMYGCELMQIPEWIGDLHKLRFTNFDYNNITSIPLSISNLTELEHLYLNNNQIQDFPEFLGELINLKWLGLCFNLIEYLPANVGDVAKESLQIAGNKLTELPDSLVSRINNNDFHYFYLSNQAATLPKIVIDDIDKLNIESLTPKLILQLKEISGVDDDWYLDRCTWNFRNLNTLETIVINQATGNQNSLYLPAGEYEISLTTTYYSGDPLSGHDYIIPVTFMNDIMLSTFIPSATFTGRVSTNTGQYNVDISGTITGSFPDGVHILTGQNIIDNSDITFTVTDRFGRESAVFDESCLLTLHVTVQNGQIISTNLTGQVKTPTGTLDRFSIMFTF